MPKLIQENIRVSDTALQDFYQTIFRWTKYSFSSSSPWRVMNNRLYSGGRINGNNPAYKNATCYFSNNSYSRCLIKPAIKLSKPYRDKIRLKSNHGTWSNTSPNENKKRADNPFLKMLDASTHKINHIQQVLAHRGRACSSASYGLTVNFP